jgi:hypothetical protein
MKRPFTCGELESQVADPAPTVPAPLLRRRRSDREFLTWRLCQKALPQMKCLFMAELESDRRTQCSNDLIAMKIRRIRFERLVFLHESEGASTKLPMDGFADRVRLMCPSSAHARSRCFTCYATKDALRRIARRARLCTSTKACQQPASTATCTCRASRARRSRAGSTR